MRKAFRDAYNEELALLYERAAEFSAKYHGIAERLDGVLRDNADPGIAGLLEGTAFLAARAQLKQREEFRGFTDELLEQFLPGLLEPLPAMMMVQAHGPEPDKLETGKRIAAGSAIDARLLDAETRVACRFRLGAAIELWPLEIERIAPRHRRAGAADHRIRPRAAGSGGAARPAGGGAACRPGDQPFRRGRKPCPPRPQAGRPYRHPRLKPFEALRNHPHHRCLRAFSGPHRAPARDAALRPARGRCEPAAGALLRRREHRLTEEELRFGRRARYLGTETFIALHEPPSPDEAEAVQRLSVRALCSNRHLPEYLPIGESRDDFHLGEDVTLRFACLTAPPPREPLAALDPGGPHRAMQGDLNWRLISYLALGAFGLDGRGGPEAHAISQHDRPEEDRFAGFLAALLGFGTPAMAGRDSLPDAARVHVAGLAYGRDRSPVRLRQILKRLLGDPVEVIEHCPSWIDIEPEDRNRLGARIRTVNDRITLSVRVKTLAAYRAYLPGGTAHRRLTDLVFWSLRDRVAVTLSLSLPAHAIPPARLGQSAELGWMAALAPAVAV